LGIYKEDTAALTSPGPPQGRWFHQVCQVLSEESNIGENETIYETICETSTQIYVSLPSDWLDGSPAVASRDQIDAIVDNYYSAPSSTASKWKRKKKAGRPQLIEQPNDQEPRETIVALHEGERGRKCRIVSVPDTEVVQRERLAHSNGDVNAHSQMRQMTVHGSMMDSDTAYIDNEIEILALEGGLTIE
jgi:hypothetical protein